MTLPTTHLMRIIFFACLFLPIQITGQAGKSKQELKKAKKDYPDDTTKIRILFQMDDRFIDGPSDSLMFYCEKANNRSMGKHYRKPDHPLRMGPSGWSRGLSGYMGFRWSHVEEFEQNHTVFP